MPVCSHGAHRSSLAHARIVPIDTRQAVPGVHGADWRRQRFVGVGNETGRLDRPRPADRDRPPWPLTAGPLPRPPPIEVEYEEPRWSPWQRSTGRRSSTRTRRTRSWGRSVRRRRTQRTGTRHPKSETGEAIEDVFARADHVFEHTFTAREFVGLPSRAPASSGSTRTSAHVINTNKAPGSSASASAGLGIPDRSSSTPPSSAATGGKAFRSTSSPATTWRDTDQGGDDLSGRDAGQQRSPSRYDQVRPRSVLTACSWPTSQK